MNAAYSETPRAMLRKRVTFDAIQERLQSMNAPFYRARAWAIRDSETKERLSYRYFNRRELPPLSQYEHTGRVVEVYKTSMQRPVACRKSKGSRA